VLPDSADLPSAGEVEREKIIVLTGRGPVADSTGNRMQESTHYMALSSAVRPDEVIFVGFLPDTSDTRNPDGHLYIWPGDPVGLRFESPLPAPEDESWHTYVSLSDTSDHIVSMDRRTNDGSSYILSDANIDGKPFDGPFILSVSTADSVYTESYIRVGAELLGELSAVFDLSSEQDRTRVELHQINAPYRLIQTLSVDPDGSIIFRSLPGGGRYFIRAFMDTDGDDAWSPGRIDPFQSPEPIFWYEVAEKVRARWETTIPDTLRIPILY